MPHNNARPRNPPPNAEFLAFDGVSIRAGESEVFLDTRWTWRAGEQWAILGPDGSGKALLVDAILGHAVVTAGEVRGPSPIRRPPAAGHAPPVLARVSPLTQREFAVRESAFYQLRWHSGLEQGALTVAQFLSQPSVEERNPYEIGARGRGRRAFAAARRRLVGWLGIGDLWGRKTAHLSNGEMRKTLLAHALLKNPDLLILEDVYAGLDAATRRRLARVVPRLMAEGLPVLVVTHRAAEIPAATTHVLLVEDHRVIAMGKRREILRVWRARFETRAGRPKSAIERTPQLGPRGSIPAGRPLVELSEVTIRGAKRAILREVTWTLREGECWALLGPNGAGKTTLLNLIQGDHPQAYAADIRLFGQRTDSTQALWRARRRIGWMSPELHQHYPANWEAEDVVCSGYFNSMGLYQPCSRRQRAAARQMLVDLGLGKHARVPFGELSFGRQRLVLLARAVVKQPALIILDEPCQGLDAAQRPQLLGAVGHIVARTGASLVFVTHHVDEIPACATHLLRLRGGRVAEMRALG
jgi:molybdate transport system ATP-binding protein